MSGATYSTALRDDRSVNPVLAMQGIVRYASSITCLPPEVLAFLQRADDVLRGGDDVVARTRADAFAVAECSVRCALNEVDVYRAAFAMHQHLESTGEKSWLSFGGAFATKKTDESAAVDRLASLLGQVLARWPRDERRLHAADRASALVRVASTDDVNMFPPNQGCCDTGGYAAVAARFMDSLFSPGYASSTTVTDDSTSSDKKKRKRLLDGAVPKEEENGIRKTPPPKLSVDTAKIEEEDDEEPPTPNKHIQEEVITKSSLSEEAAAPPKDEEDVVAAKEEEAPEGEEEEEEEYAPSERSDVECTSRDVERLICVARAEMANGDAMVRARDSSRASRVYRGAVARLHLLRCSLALDSTQLRDVADAASKAGRKARAKGHVLENATVEHAAFIPKRRRSKARSSLLVQRRGFDDDIDLFSEASDDESGISSSAATKGNFGCFGGGGGGGGERISQSSQSTSFGSEQPIFLCAGATTNGGGRKKTSFQGPPALLSSASLSSFGNERRHKEQPRRVEAVYKLAKTPLGQGSYGVVRVVTRRSDGERFACKTVILPKDLADAAVERAHSEIAAMRKLDHPNICRVHDVFYAKRKVHLIMDLCTGGELWQMVLRHREKNQETRRVVDEGKAAELCRQMLSAVHYMHTCGVCHRDLKPQNWLFASEAEDAPLKLVDFGLAKHFSETPPPSVFAAQTMRSTSRRKSRRMACTDWDDDDDEDDDDFDDEDDDDRPPSDVRCCSTLDEFLAQPRQKMYYYGGPPTADMTHPVQQAIAQQQQQPLDELSIDVEEEDEFDDDDDAMQIDEESDDDDDDNDEDAVERGRRRKRRQDHRSRSRTALQVKDEEESSPLEEKHEEIQHSGEVVQRTTHEPSAGLVAERARLRHRSYLSDRVGSFYFVAPEVLRGAHDARCDLWSLGVIAYMLLSGAPPFGGRTDREILARVAKAKLTFPVRLFGTISAQARLFVARLLDRDVGRRVTAEQALQETWIVDRCGSLPLAVVHFRDDSKTALSKRILRAVRKFATLDALAKLVLLVITARLPAYIVDASARRDFAAFDMDCDGRLSLSEFFDALGGGTDTALLDEEDHIVAVDDDDDDERPITIEEAAALFDAADVKADGHCVSYREFVAATASERMTVTDALLRDTFDAISGTSAALTPDAVKAFVGIDRCLGTDDHVDAPTALLSIAPDGYLPWPAFSDAISNALHLAGFPIDHLMQQQQQPQSPPPPPPPPVVLVPTTSSEQRQLSDDTVTT